MKLSLHFERKRQAGGTLVASMIICTILGASMLGYMHLVSMQSRMSARSQTWNLAIGIAEAGIEEGLQHLNQNPDNLGSDNWSVVGGAFSKSRALSNGSYSIYITNSATPTIYTCATVTTPYFASSPDQIMLATIGMEQVSSSVSRALVVTTQRSGMVAKGMVAKGKITMNGNNITTDSFSSCYGAYDPNHAGDNGDVASNAGIENSVDVGNADIYGHVSTGPGGSVANNKNAYVGSHADRASGGDGVNTNWVSHNANFTFPDVELPYTSGFTPGGGDIVTASYSVSSTVNTNSAYPVPAPVAGVSTNLGTTTISSLPSPPLPAGLTTNTTSTTTTTYPSAGTYIGSVTTTATKHGTTWTTNYTYNLITSYSYPSFVYVWSTSTTNVTYMTNHYDHIINAGDYYATSLSGNTIVIGEARLVLPNGLSMSGQDSITIASTGKIKVYAGGTSVAVGGNGVINQPGQAEKFILYCTPTVTDFSLSGNAAFTGVVIAPEADVKLNGGGNNTTDFSGSLMANTVTMNGHFNFHYDECLTNLVSDGRFLATSWNEVAPH